MPRKLLNPSEKTTHFSGRLLIASRHILEIPLISNFCRSKSETTISFSDGVYRPSGESTVIRGFVS